MNSPIGHTFLYNIIILFIVIVFGFIAGILSYYKAFKVNNNIVHSLEKFEGYNEFSKAEIDIALGNLGYSLQSANCKAEYNGMYLVSLGENYRYCIYIDPEVHESGEYYQYGVLTYMNLDLPVINLINIPIFTRTNLIYKFTNDESL